MVLDARPYPFEIMPERCALIVIDMQRDFMEPGGFGAMLGNDGRPCLLRRSPSGRRLPRLLQQRSRAAGMLAHSHARRPSGGPYPDLSPAQARARALRNRHRRCGSDGPPSSSAANPRTRHHSGAVSHRPGEPVIDKPGKGAFHATDLHAILENRGISATAGLWSDHRSVVSTTVREANDRGYGAWSSRIVARSYFPSFHDAALADDIVAQGGIFRWVGIRRPADRGAREGLYPRIDNHTERAMTASQRVSSQSYG